MLKPFFTAVVLSLACVCANAQNNLPSAPAPAAPAASKPDFSMPATVPHTALPPSPAPAEKPADPLQDTFCTAPSESGRILIHQSLSKPQLDELRDFNSNLMQRLRAEWVRHMPRAFNNTWIQNKFVLLRFEILPNGAVHDPAIMMSSGRNDFDDHVLRSLIAAQPYPLPDGFTHPVRSCIRFGYNPNEQDHFKPDPLFDKPYKTNP